MNANKIFNEDVTLTEFASESDILVSKFDKRNGMFETSCPVSNNLYYDYQPKIFVYDNTAYVSFIENIDNEPLSLSGKNEIYLAKITQDGQVENECLSSLQKPVIQSDIGLFNDLVTVVYTCDLDGDLSTNQDVDAFIVSDNLIAQRITNDDVCNENPQISLLNELPVISYFSNGNIYYSYDSTNFSSVFESSDVMMGIDYKFVSNDSSSILFYNKCDRETNQSNIHACVYNNELWSDSICVTNSENNIKYFYPFIKADGTIGLVYTKVQYEADIEEKTEEGYNTGVYTETNDLYVISFEKYNDIEINDVAYDHDELIPSSSITISFVVTNKGFYPVDAVTITVSDNNLISFSETLTCDINIGESKKMSVDIEIPSTFATLTELDVSLETEIVDSDTTNNTQTIKIGYADLVISSYYYCSWYNKSCVINVENKSAIPTGAKVIFREGSYDGKILETYKILNLEPFSKSSYYFDWDSLSRFYSTGETVYIEIVGNAEEYVKSNNKSFFVLTEPSSYYKDKVLEIYERVSETGQIDEESAAFISAAMEHYNSFSEDEKSTIEEYTLIYELFNVMCAQEFYEQGLGMENNPYVVTNTYQLDMIRKYPTLSYVLGNDINMYAEGYSDWNPIETFDGKLDGNGYSITNYTSTQGGLIKTLTGSLLNIYIQNVNIDIKNDESEEYVKNLGALVHQMTSTAQISGCGVSGQVYAETVENLGGLVGNNSYGSICKSFAEIDMYVVSQPQTDTIYSNIGGMVGFFSFDNSTIYDCYSSGKITTNNPTSHTGGFIGYVSTPMIYLKPYTSRCFAYVTFDCAGVVGGFIGEQLRDNSKNTDCFYLCDNSDIPVCGNSNNSNVAIAVGKTVAEFANGSVAYEINLDEDKVVFYQNLGEDTYPVLNNKHKQVYFGFVNCGTVDASYFNTITVSVRPQHNFVDGICLVCGHGPENHVKDDWDIVLMPTCTELGKQIIKCKICDEILETQELPATGHNYEPTVIAPTCIENGHTKYTCLGCGDSYTSDETLANGHTFGEWEIAIPPICTETGEQVKKCTVCGEILEIEEIPANGHTESEWEILVAPTCTYKGKRTKKCTVCTVIIITEELPANGHTEGEWVITNEPTCTVGGLQVKRCDVCDTLLETQRIPEIEHLLGDWKITTQPTCNLTGEKVKKCTICNRIAKTEVLPATGKHIVGEWEIITEPTTETVGQSVKKCTVCGNVIEAKEIPMLTDTSGFCGNDLLWNYDAETKTLTISGTGAMYDYTATNRPWEVFEDEITTIVIGDDVTSIGRLAFYHFGSLTYVNMGGVTTIGMNAFNVCKTLKYIEISKNVIVINSGAFNNCIALSDVYYEGVQDEWNAITIGTNNTYLTSATLHCQYKNQVLFVEKDMHIEGLLYQFNSLVEFKNRVNLDGVYIKVYDVNGIELTNEDLVGTGATVYIYNVSTNEFLDTYTVVLYGDVNGDGLINKVDKEIITNVAICQATIENEWFLMAADTNHDGTVDAFDVIETELQSLDMHNIEQVNNSAYMPKKEEEVA